MKLSNDDKLILYFSLVVLIQWIIFDSLKFTWTNDPFQKIILAPLGEEPYKLIIALFLCIIIWLTSKKNLSNIFRYGFVYFSIAAGIFFGVFEGPLGNIIIHISTTTIGAIFILLIYLKVKDKTWKNRYKLIVMYIPIILSMFIHSLSNQFTNLKYVETHQSFNNLVMIARFLVDNNFDSRSFVLSLFGVTFILIIIWHLYLYSRWEKNRDSKDAFIQEK